MTQTILLVEDSPLMMRTTTAVLARTFRGARIIQAEDASRAIAVLSSELIDLVVSDFDLGPKANGLDVLHWCRDHLPGMESRFCFLTGEADSIRRLHPHVLEKGQPLHEITTYLTAMVEPVTV